MAESRKFYWLKLQKDFFKRHDIRIVESMPNGKDYILFYLKLLVESISHYGHLRFSETIPYTDEMLSTITNTNIDIVRSAIKIFTELKMIQILDDHTIFMSEVEKMVGSETEWAEKKRVYRGQCPQLVLPMSDKSKNKKIDKEIDKEKEKNLFDDFWREYPKKKSKGTAEKAWNKIKPTQELAEIMIESLMKAKRSKEWTKDKGQFIPYPATWLNSKGWEDEYEVLKEKEFKISDEQFKQWGIEFDAEGNPI